MQRLCVGATFSDAAFLSTSRKKCYADDKEKDAENGRVCFHIESRTGVNVKMYSRHPEEDEILFRAESMFRITNVWLGKYGAMHVEMSSCTEG